ncbi:MAG: 1,6-anhydro-N-acetylmuramyl-L-alanine amidase AmpD [Gammaproteobacteria bacterium]|nr:1,6-anhydro-N-acetylmuramyl-L-alanine amidase AmpD [Gammaproteobacteria bacterium]MCP4091575.1 1,6-anhydro-N-acetylmuramyl-L-alanine amidase AmpD [Gammaproteobacteria bacterium]MCP4276071.1 1,6-anhydro-N-acetylmuramyl-L-alanine amidase AmpD [Gammaproteobacteria bacterium]MCP4832563.1 1,6-anhydro-N-acetylmuramyl-L-alanine amidase AmpD [Gammaproteobacteria bacterium]MCP4929641.1 1,6-anhydro-N-acetylmuramyl-L-alanine amidase AmpD [Gammaproteobacteria bacterium]
MFAFDPDSGLLAEARQLASPNCDQRPAACEPDLIVVHGISLPPGEFGGPWIDQLFTNTLSAAEHPYFAEIADLRVSAHFLISRDGALVQYVSVNLRAWHAGESCFASRESCNDFSIGIELEGEDQTPYEKAQYDCLAMLIDSLRTQKESLTDACVVGHSDIAPGRKTDPGEAFDWHYLDGLLSTKVNNSGTGRD